MDVKTNSPEMSQPAEEDQKSKSEDSGKKQKEKLPRVSIVRNFEEYVGESLLIVFSVALALLLTEVLDAMNERRKTKELLKDIRSELIHNKVEEERQFAYHQQVATTLDSLIGNPELAKTILVNGRFNLNRIAPHGVLYGDLEDVAWEAGKAHEIAAKIDISTLSLLDDIYDDQTRIFKLEDEVGRLLLSPESRKNENLYTTLVLLQDNFRAWSLGRGNSLIKHYQQAIDRLGTQIAK